ncbi:MAG: MBL fold metallo-hydrolase [bacterium]|nr:MBL fold metallo-hydrolase [bacterium]
MAKSKSIHDRGQTVKMKESNINPHIIFWSGASTVTGANFEFSAGGKRILVDCGLLQGVQFADKRNAEPFPYNPADIDYLFVTHAHIDHIGRVPKLVKDGFKGKITSTEATLKIAKFMFEDALSIMRYENKNGENLLYEEDDVSKALSVWQTIEYGKPLQLSHDLAVTAKDAGHILGSAMYEFEYGNGRKIKAVFTGDLGNSPAPLLPNTEIISDADYVVMESVYGDRNHEGSGERKNKLLQAVTRTIKKKGTLLIPSFSLEKTQVLLYEINEMVENGKVGDVAVFLDSPLAIKITGVYSEMSHHFKGEVRKEVEGGDDIFEFPGLKMTPRVRQSQDIANAKGPKIIIAGSGMSAGGRILRHEEIYLGDENATILFVGYQSPGSLGREIQDGARSVQIGNKKVFVKAKVETISGYSSHKDSDGLLNFVENTAGSLKKTFVVMGEPKAAFFLVQKLRDYLGVEAVHPSDGEKVELEF